MKKKAIVLGAGVTGLRMGKYLSDNGYSVTVIEKTPKIGGMASAFKYKDYVLDYGPHKFYTQLNSVYEDFKEIIGENNYLTVKKSNSIRLLGKYFDFPIKFTQLLTRISPVVALRILLDFAKSSLNKKPVLSYEDYFINGFGKTGYEIIFKGFAEKVWGNPRNLSEELARRRSPVGSIFDILKTLVQKNKNVSAEYFYYPVNGYGVISDRLSDSIIGNGGKILLNHIPEKINVKNKKAVSVTVRNNGKRKNLKCDVLVSSLAITDLPGLIGNNLQEKIALELKNLKFRSLIIAYVFLNVDRALKENWIFFPEKNYCFNRIAEQKSFSRSTVPDGKTVLTAEITCDYNDSTYTSSEDELKKIVLRDLDKAGIIKEDQVIDFFTKKAGRVYPVYSIEYRPSLEKVLDWLDSFPNIYTVGRLGLFNYNNVDHCLDMAKVTADIIIKNKPRTYWKEARKYFDSYRIVD